MAVVRRQGGSGPAMPVGGSNLRTRTSPIPTDRTVRVLEHRTVTSIPAGLMTPLVAFPLLREDALRMSRYRFNFEMMETAELLANGVVVTVMAYVVPHLAFDRFDGMDSLNRSYQKQPAYDGGPVTPFFQGSTVPIGPQSGSNNAVLYHLGEHFAAGGTYNAAYHEAYNEIWNMRAKNRSPDIPLITSANKKLQPAFWPHHPFAQVVPDFDQATIDGEVPLNVTAGALPIRGLGATAITQPPMTLNMFETAGPYVGPGFAVVGEGTTAAAGQAKIGLASDAAGAQLQVFAEMAENGITVSLANIEVARKTQAFALLRKAYEGIDDDYIIDLLMQGVSVPEQQMRQPILLGSRQSVFGMAKRFSSDSLDLTASVVNGAASVELGITCPRLSTGGIVMIVAEVVPEQLFERQQDYLLGITDQDLLPNFLRDTLDPEKVEVVAAGVVDTLHTTPAATFGYAPLNWRLNRQPPKVGGKFYRPAVDDPLSEDRMRFWISETVDPTLSADFYLANNLSTDVFVDTASDPFECSGRGVSTIEGNTVFGRVLLEADDVYDEIMAEVPFDRIDKSATTVADAGDAPSPEVVGVEKGAKR